jgi:hypothetical protein
MTGETMSYDPDNQRPDIKRGAPSSGGKEMDIVQNDRGMPERTWAPDQLHVCFHCAGELVFPLDWSEEGARHWRIVLRCPECESRREGVFEQAAVERLEDELDRAAAALLGDLRRVTHANMSDEIEFFIRALDADLIDAGDF